MQFHIKQSLKLCVLHRNYSALSLNNSSLYLQLRNTKLLALLAQSHLASTEHFMHFMRLVTRSVWCRLLEGFL